MKCSQCHKEVSSQVNFCPYCGAEITGLLYNYQEGVRLFCDGAYEEALRHFKIACLTNPDDPTIIKDCGHAYLHSGKLTESLKMYDKAEKLGGSFLDLKYNRALIYLSQKRLEKAQQLFQDILQNQVDFAPGRFYLGLLFEKKELFLSDCHLYQGLIWKELDKIDEAIIELEKATELNPHHVTALHNLGDLYFHQKSYDQTIEKYNQVINLSPLGEDIVDVHNSLALAYYENNQLDEAIRELNWVLQRHPGHPAAVHNLHQIYEREGIISRKGKKRPVSATQADEVASHIFSLSLGVGKEGVERDKIMIVGRSKAMQQVMRHARLAAASDATVLITGENGTGKELLARMIYYNSLRRAEPFIVVNCATIPENLLESELFGHEKGAFTDASSRKLGRFELANRGTIFLDEIGDLPPKLQVKLLRVLQEKEFSRVGGNEVIKVDVRIIAATNRDLKGLMKEGRYREDLYFRLNVLPIYIPSLRQRKEDIPILVDYFLKKYSARYGRSLDSLSTEDMENILSYDWPGNIRELENMIERAVVMGTQTSLYLEEISRLKKLKRVVQGLSKTDYLMAEEAMSLEELERSYIRKVLQQTSGNQKKAAEILGINPSTLWRKLKQYQINAKNLTRDKA